MSIDLTLPDMTCGHCEKTVRAAIASVDPKAAVTVDLPSHLVRVDTDAPRERVLQALADEGYPAAA